MIFMGGPGQNDTFEGIKPAEIVAKLDKVSLM